MKWVTLKRRLVVLWYSHWNHGWTGVFRNLNREERLKLSRKRKSVFDLSEMD